MTAFDLFNSVLKKAIAVGASDVHVTPGNPYRLRIQGDIVSLPGGHALKPEDTAAIASEILVHGRKATRANVDEMIQTINDLDCSYAIPELSRFRVNICCQRGSLALVLRAIPFRIPDFDDLGLPLVIRDIAMEERGLVLLTGITGSGKSTTLAAMLNHINQNKPRKIVTIEDPIEFLFSDVKSTVIQRELGADTPSFATALRAALRQDPDVIMVGEMRDRETIDIALKAAETGHLVLSTVHTTDAPKTITRLLSVFEVNEQHPTRLRMAETLKGIISQRLLVKKDGKGRVVAAEIMRNTKTIQDCIENPEKTGTIKDYLMKGTEQYGMQTFDQHLTDLYLRNQISMEVAKTAATSPADFERNLVYQ